LSEQGLATKRIKLAGEGKLFNVKFDQNFEIILHSPELDDGIEEETWSDVFILINFTLNK
jgi:hypothetical protein